MVRRAAGLVLLGAAAFTASASAQSLPRNVFDDVRWAIGDAFWVYTAPLHTDGSDLATLGILIGAAGGIALLDEPIDRWIRTHPSSALLEPVEPFREGNRAQLVDLGSGSLMTRVGGALWLVGLVSGSEGLRDAGIGCAAAEKTQSALRHGVYKLVSRRRPLTEEGEPDPWDFDVPGGDWEHHSFFGGHGANIMTCASFINYRFDLGWAEPAIMALAVGVNIGRVVDRRHWASDAFVGAAVGVAIGKAFADRQLERRRDRTGVESEGGAGRSGGIDVGTRDGVVYLGWRQWF
jgi:hypothetical protein